MKLEEEGVIVDSRGEMELVEFMHPNIAASKKKSLPEKWWQVLSKKKLNYSLYNKKIKYTKITYIFI